MAATSKRPSTSALRCWSSPSSWACRSPISASQAVFFSQGAAFYIRRELFNTIQRYSFENFDHRPTGDLMVRLNADVVNIQNAVLYTLLLGSLAPFLLLLTIVMALINTPDLVWVVIVVIVAVLAIMALLVPAIDRAYRHRQEALDELNGTFQENLTGISVVKAFVRERVRDREVRAASCGAARTRIPGRMAGGVHGTAPHRARPACNRPRHVGRWQQRARQRGADRR